MSDYPSHNLCAICGRGSLAYHKHGDFVSEVEWNDVAIDVTSGPVALIGITFDQGFAVPFSYIPNSHPARHLSQGHEKGTLYDCPGCEAGCFCVPGFVCVGCATLRDAFDRTAPDEVRFK